jgi:hypothetical protein
MYFTIRWKVIRYLIKYNLSKLLESSTVPISSILPASMYASSIVNFNLTFLEGGSGGCKDLEERVEQQRQKVEAADRLFKAAQLRAKFTAVGSRSGETEALLALGQEERELERLLSELLECQKRNPPGSTPVAVPETKTALKKVPNNNPPTSKRIQLPKIGPPAFPGLGPAPRTFPSMHAPERGVKYTPLPVTPADELQGLQKVFPNIDLYALQTYLQHQQHESARRFWSGSGLDNVVIAGAGGTATIVVAGVIYLLGTAGAAAALLRALGILGGAGGAAMPAFADTTRPTPAAPQD